MKLYVIIAIILLVGIVPHVSNASQRTAERSGGRTDSLNLSLETPGHFPEAEDGYTFSILNHSNDYNISVVQTGYGNALNIWSSPNDGVIQWTDLGITLPVYSNANVSFTYSWNYNNNYLDTISNFALQGPAGRMIYQHFGSARGMNDTINGNGSYAIGKMPPINTRLVDNFTIGSSILDPVLFFMGNLSTSENEGPIAVIPSNFSSSGGIELVVGGPFCNITIYSISITNLTYGVFPAYGGNAGNMKEKSIGYFPGLGPDDGHFSYSAGSSSLIFLNSSAHSIESLNLNNQSLKVINKINGSESYILTTSKYGIYTVFNGNNTGTNITQISESNLSESKFSLNYSMEGTIAILQGSPSSYAAISSNSTTLINNSTIVRTFAENGSDLIAASFRNGTVSVLRYSVGFNAFYRYEISTSKGFSTNSVFLYPQTVTGFESHLLLRNSSAIASAYASTPAAGTFINSGSNLRFLVPEISSGNLIQEGALISGINGSYILNSTGYYSLRNSTGLDFIFSSGNSLFFLHGRNLTVFYDGNYPVQRGNISIALNLSSYYDGVHSSINISIISSSRYTVRAFVDGISCEASNSSITFDSYDFSNGTNSVCVTAGNSFGDSVSVMRDFLIDNYAPDIHFNSNLSDIKGGTNISMEIGNVPENYVRNITVKGYRINGNSDRYIIQIPPSMGGSQIINISIVDLFGRHYNFSYMAFVIPEISPTNLSIIDGNYISSGNLNLTWKPVNGSDYYEIIEISNGVLRTIRTNYSREFLEIPNGNCNLSVYAIFSGGSKILVGRSNFTVMDYGPDLNLRLNSTLASFFGDSKANEELLITVNTSSSLEITVLGPQNQALSEVNLSDSSEKVLNLSRLKGVFSQSGIYRIEVSGTDLSGLTSEKCIEIIVNNTIPTLSYVPDTFYTNTSAYKLNSLFRGSGQYNLSIISINGSSASVSNEGIMEFTGNYSRSVLNITYVDPYGNWNFSHFTVVYSDSLPTVSIDNIEYSGNGTYTVNYSSNSEVPENIRFLLDGSVVNTTTSEYGRIWIKFTRNGIYTVQILSRDACGNTYSSIPVNLSVKVFTVINSMNFRGIFLINFGFLKIQLNGTSLNDVKIKMLVDGRPSGSSSVVLFTLLPGFYNVTGIADYANHQRIIRESVFSTGIIPEFLLAALFIWIYVHRNYKGTKDSGAILQYLKSRPDVPLRVILKESGSNNISKSALRKFLREESGSKLTRKRDPDGEIYVTVKKP